MSVIIIKYLAKLLKQLNSGQTPGQISGGVVIGTFVGLVPFNWLYSLTVGSLLYFLNVNGGMGFIAIFLVGFVAFLIDPIAHSIGSFLLMDVGFLKPLWTLIYNVPILPFAKLNNTVTLGSIVVAAIVAFPIYIIVKKLVTKYRTVVMVRIQNLRIMKVLSASKFASIF